MDTYFSLSPEILEGDISSIDKPFCPVSVGTQFKLKDNRNCIVTKLYEKSFAYTYINESLLNERVKEMIVSYNYWHRNAVVRERGIKLKMG